MCAEQTHQQILRGSVTLPKGLNGEACFCLITDHHNGMFYGAMVCSKAPPIQWINQWLVKHAMDCPMMSRTSMSLWTPVAAILVSALRLLTCLRMLDSYSVHLSASGPFQMNGQAEHPIQMNRDAIHTMFGAAGLCTKFWLYAFTILSVFTIGPAW